MYLHCILRNFLSCTCTKNFLMRVRYSDPSLLDSRSIFSTCVCSSSSVARLSISPFSSFFSSLLRFFSSSISFIVRTPTISSLNTHPALSIRTRAHTSGPVRPLNTIRSRNAHSSPSIRSLNAHSPSTFFRY